MITNINMDIEGIDELDKKILTIIADNARLTYSEIAERIGDVSRVSVKNRMKALEERGIIRGYKTVIDPTGDPNGIRFFMDIETEPESLHDVVDMLAGYRYNRQIFTATGESRIHVMGYVPNNATLRSYVDSVYRKLKGVRRIICHEILVTHKDVDGGIDYVRYKESEYMEGGHEGQPDAE
ncbi:MAG: Lrp/AsnC family transcriptional regulator [Lachnospiraceae bacterium]|nr:Lrp/AsnC family transcriptional regulator [Lachnospiraceae bacterium]